MLGNPRRVLVLQRPTFNRVQHPPRMHFRHIIQMIRHGLAHIQTLIRLQPIQYPGRQLRIRLHRVQPKRPGQARAAAFAGQASNVVIFVSGPVVHPFQRALEVAAQKVADGEFGGAEGGEVLEGFHGGVERMPAVARDVVRQTHANESAV
ncbi:hypothetical protein D3C81_1848920 [compost metagenome]